MCCLSLIGPSGPAVIATSITALPSVPVGPGPLGQVPVAAEIAREISISRESLSEFAQLHSDFIGLPQRTKKVARVSMRRLSLALRRRWKVDAALDLGVALEVLFADGRPNDSSIGFSLRLRAARLLRTDPKERRALSSAVANLYKLRSSAAHEGELPKKIGDATADQILDTSAAIVAEAIRVLIKTGMPDWDALVYG
jgi:hypothetical protein